MHLQLPVENSEVLGLFETLMCTIFSLIIICDCHCLSIIMIKYSLVSYSFFAKYVDSVAVSDRRTTAFPFVDGCIAIAGEMLSLGSTVNCIA